MDGKVEYKTLSRRQQAFCEEYVIDYNKFAAAKRAGYSEKNAGKVAGELLKNPAGAAYISELEAEKAKQKLVTPEYIINGLKEVAERCLQRVPVMEFDWQEKRLVQKTNPETNLGEWTFDASGANKAFELLGKHLGIFEKDNRQRSNVINVNVVTQNNTIINLGDQDGGSDTSEHPGGSIYPVL